MNIVELIEIVTYEIKRSYPQWTDFNYIGGGGYSLVFKIRDKFAFSEEEEHCVIKVLNFEKKNGMKILSDAHKEGKIHYDVMRKLENRGLDGIVKIFGGHLIENYPILRMEYLELGSLKDNFEKLTYSEKLSIYKEICRIIAHLHSNQTVHRDIKPQNILLTKDLKPKLADFGLTRENEGRQTFTIGGTEGYAAPEVMAGQKTLKSDVYALGILGIELFSCKEIQSFYPTNYHEISPFEVAATLCNTIPSNLACLGDEKKWLIDLLVQAIAPNVNDRNIRAYDIFTAIASREQAGYITLLGEYTPEQIEKDYTRLFLYEPTIGKKIYFAQVSESEKQIHIIGYIIVGQVNKVGNRNFKVLPLDNKYYPLTKQVTITNEYAKLFKLQPYHSKFKKPKLHLRSIKQISHDAEKFIEDNSK